VLFRSVQTHLSQDEIRRLVTMNIRRPLPGEPDGPPSSLVLLGPQYQGRLPAVYQEAPWTESYRRRLSGSESETLAKTKVLMAIFERDPRYRSLLDTLSRDDTLPAGTREEIERALNALGPPPAIDSPSAPRDKAPVK
jgi:hypothetical protein